MKVQRAAALAVGWALLAAPAFAGDAACLWKQVPQSRREMFLAGADGEPTPRMEEITNMFAGADVKAVFAACGANEATSKDAVFALLGYSYVEFAVRRLEGEHAVTRAQLETGWTTMDPAARKILIDSVDDPQHREPPKSAMLDFLTHAGLKDKQPPDSTTGQTLIAYMYGRAEIAAHESKF